MGRLVEASSFSALHSQGQLFRGQDGISQGFGVGKDSYLAWCTILTCRQRLTLENLINVGWLDDNYQPSYGTLTTPFLASSAIVPLRRGLPQGRRFAEIPDNMKEKVISGVRSRVNIWVSLKVRYTHLNCHLNLERDNDDCVAVNQWI